MTMLLLFLVLGHATAHRRWFELNEKYSFDEYLREFGKNYQSPVEYIARRALFESRLSIILAHNANPSSTWKRGVNWLTDLHDEEIPKGLIKSSKRHLASAVPNVAAIPEALDWRDASVVTPVKNQGSCGSCWAFAATECMESAVAIATGKLLVLSPQVWVDCAKNPDECGGSGGCQGATAEIAYETAMSLGAYNDSSVPYVAQDEMCALTVKPVANFSGYVRVPSNNYSALLEAVTTQPVAVSVDASWPDYESGVFPASEGGTDIDHGVQLVGFGTDPTTGLDYWLIRNSWGATWGEEGYIRLQRSPDGGPCAIDSRNQDGVGCKEDPSEVAVCGTSGILYDASYPTGASVLF